MVRLFISYITGKVKLFLPICVTYISDVFNVCTYVSQTNYEFYLFFHYVKSILIIYGRTCCSHVVAVYCAVFSSTKCICTHGTC